MKIMMHYGVVVAPSRKTLEKHYLDVKAHVLLNGSSPNDTYI
jgi:hypothetical protein